LAGGTPISPSLGSAERAEGIFRSSVREVEEATKPAVRNVFISFSISDEGPVNLLRSQARDENFDMEFRDYSVKEPFDEAWKRQCRDKMFLTSATICMIGPDTASRPAVTWELEESYRQGKKVAGVRIYKDSDDPIPKPLLEHGAPILLWKRDLIRKFLEDP
jgi:hypothetical protein